MPPCSPRLYIPIRIQQRLPSQRHRTHWRTRVTSFAALTKRNSQPEMLCNAALQNRPRILVAARRRDDALTLDDPRGRCDKPHRDSLTSQLAVQSLIRRVMISRVKLRRNLRIPRGGALLGDVRGNRDLTKSVDQPRVNSLSAQIDHPRISR